MMYTARAQQAFEIQNFFFEQKAKLTSLLNTIGQEAKSAPFPICMDYPELTDAVTQLLGEAQVASGLTYDQLQQAGVEMRPFAEKVQLVENVAADARTRAMTAAKPVSRKRGRRDEEDEDEMAGVSYSNTSNKRNRNVPASYDMVIEPNYCGPYAERFLQTAWWTQQLCD